MRFLPLIILLIGCGSRDLPPSEYVRWIVNPENEFRSSKTRDGIEFTAQLKSPEYILLVERGIKPESPNWEKELAELNELTYLNLYLEPKSKQGTVIINDNTSQSDYHQKFDYYQFRGEEDFSLEVGGKTLECSLYHLERTYNLTSKSTILLGFPRIWTGEEMVLKYSNELLPSGPMKFRLGGNPLPTLAKS